jgi:hypothetical protein
LLVLLRKQPPPIIPVEYKSTIHFKTFDVLKFHEFLVAKVSVDNVYQPMVNIVANQLYNGSLDLRDMDNADSDFKQIKEFMYSKYLPLASQTQFVEAGVKEARNVSPTDRSEMLRSAYAVSRSARVHSIGDLRYIKSTQRIEELLHSAIIHSDEHEAFKANDPTYKQTITSIAKDMREEHFKEERVRKIQEQAAAKLYKNKKENIIQKKSGVDRTHAMDGLFPYGKLVKKLHFDALKEELLFRGCSEQEVNDWTITQHKTKLKELETKRVDNDEVQEVSKAAALKAFKPLSGVHFQSD